MLLEQEQMHMFSTIKYNFNGVEQWVARFPEFGAPRAIETDKRGNIYIAGLGASSSCGNDFIVIKYNSNGIQQWVVRYECSPFVSVKENSISPPAAFYLFAPFPSPFSSTTTIKFSILKSASVNLTVYDIFGRKIENILNQQMEAEFIVYFGIKVFIRSGTYLVSMICGEFKQTRKLILLK
jgi:hypothetical protein